MDLLIKLLGDENARLFYAYCIVGQSSKEIGQAYQLSENCVRMRVSRMKKKIIANQQLFFALVLLLLVRR